ncbi:MAG: DUF3008 family protein [Candidatus Paceibacterota bacterium]
MNEETFKPTLSKPTPLGAKFQKDSKKIGNQFGVKLNETDGLLSEAEQSLKKKIFSLAKMEALVFSDPKLSAKYDEMAENGEEKYGYHYNETIQNMLFNDYVLNSPKYLQKYKQAIPKEKKRRDASGINQLKKAGEETMQHKIDIKKPQKLAASGLKPVVAENDEPLTRVEFLVNERDPQNPDLFAYFPDESHHGEFKTAYSHVGQHSSAHPNYAKESRPATPEEYAPLKTELESLGYNLEVINGIAETTGAGSSGAFSAPLGIVKRELAEEEKIDETTGSASSGAYVGPAVWGSGDLMKTKGKAKVKTQPAIKGGTIIQESNYLIEPNSFEKYFNALNEEADVFLNGQDNNGEAGKSIISSEPAAPQVPVGLWDKVKMEGRKEVDDKIINKTTAFTNDTVKNWNDQDASIEIDTINTGDPDKVNLQTMEESKQIQEKSVSKSQQKFMGMVHAVQKGELPKSEVGGKVAKAANTMKEKDAEDFASTKHKGLPEKVDETEGSIIVDNPNSMSNKMTPTSQISSAGNVPTGLQNIGGGAMNESDIKLLEELDNELKAYSIHHKKLVNMSEDKKPSSLILKDRLGDENQANFKKDLQHSGTKEIIDVEKELQWKDQQTEVGKDPQKLGTEIEDTEIKATDAKSGEALKNVGNSTNDKGDEIPKRNLTTEEQDEVNKYRLSLKDYVYDNKPDQKFEDRMKADMGETNYKQRQTNLEFRGKAPMYNKDPQPVEDTTAKKVQFDKEQTGWNEREGLKEHVITGKYFGFLGKKKLINFKLNEAQQLVHAEDGENLFELNFDGLGNKYNNRVIVNENVNTILSENKFYTNGMEVFIFKTPVQKLNENEQKSQKPVINEQFEKMKHLTGYKPNSFTDTSNVKKNRGF